MSDTPRPTSLGEAFYGPSGPRTDQAGPTPGAISGGQAPTLRNPDSDRPSSLASALYGAGVDPSIARTKQGIGGDQAPAGSTMGSIRYGQNGPVVGAAPGQTTQPQSWGQVFYGDSAQPAETAPTDPASEAETPQQQAAEAAQREAMEQFTVEAEAMGLGDREKQTLIDMHTQQVQQLYQQHAQTASAWRADAEKTFSPGELRDIRSRFDRAIGDDADAREFKRLLAWSGAGNHKSTLRCISRMLARR
jgi:hypothetical protein